MARDFQGVILRARLFGARADDFADDLLDNHDVHRQQKRVQRLLVVLDEPLQRAEDARRRPPLLHTLLLTAGGRGCGGRPPGSARGHSSRCQIAARSSECTLIRTAHASAPS